MKEENPIPIMTQMRDGQRPELRTHREPERIAGVMRRLEAVWRGYPSLRLGQLIGNVFHSTDAGGGRQYFVEDEEIIKTIEDFPPYSGVIKGD